ncbi:adenylate/guanylate cyclase domain-containing protein [Cellulosimicrobium sp. SH8]|uniref:adenylate/guanylate cyclase domain-containing protein n=1 Tax=Cellulosimicrobium sp. SH8 TaxID=2952936 RepID=UPI0021F3C382|nr:adenylate/guanylate cyclase domain-containing protein [Cellulosimicrobium sp. SH8]
MADDFDSKLTSILYASWNIQDARVVPKTVDVVQRDGAKRLEATYLYADMADSTLLAKKFPPEIAARIVRAYLRIAVDCIRAKGGHIRSFDGDRVMGIFIGDRRRNDAVSAGLNISWVVEKELNPKLGTLLWNSVDPKWQVSHRSGIDDGQTFIVRGGARDNSDLVSIGDAPNIAAKLSGIRGESGSMTITSRVYGYLFDHNKMHQGTPMWKKRSDSWVGPHRVDTYSCGWMRKP